MKKLVYLFVAISLVLAMFPVVVSGHTEDDPFVTDLIAGGGNQASAMNVGDVLVWNDADMLYIRYVITDLEWCITETHLQVATSLSGIPQKNDNPIPGKFEENDEHACVTEVLYTYNLVERGWTLDTGLYLAAHAVVQSVVGYEDPNLDNFAAALPDQVTMSVQYPYGGGPAYFPVTTVTGDPLTGTYEGWCVDTDNVIYQNTNYTANVYSSYETLPEGLVEYPENLDLVNWIINQGYVDQPSACGGTYTYGDIQRAIWALIEDNQSTSGLGSWSQCRVDGILAAAYASGEGFVPGCDDYVAVILQPIDGQQVISIAQVTFASVGVPCSPLFEYETAWGTGFDFPGKNWATYLMYTVQGEMPEEWPEDGTLSVAYEDLPIDGGNDWDYNDLVVDIDTLATFYGTSADRDLVEMDFTIRPEAKIAGYHHHLRLAPDAFACDGTYELTIGTTTTTGVYDKDVELDVVVLPDSNTLVQAHLRIYFTVPAEGCPFEFPVWNPNHYHGESLFYNPYIYVFDNGQTIGRGDVRMLTVPVDWQWPTPDGNRICNVYPKVTNCSPGPPTFVSYWWTP